MEGDESEPNNTGPGSTNPWKEFAVLSFDGGGIRGYASLLLLREVMRVIQMKEKEYPDHQESSFQPIFHPRMSSNGHPGLPQSSNSPISPDDRPPWRRVSTLEPPHRPQGSDESKTEKQLSGAFLPCHYFDYMFGTSTGGLNAIMLGRLRMSIDECIGHYPGLVKEIFGRPRAKMMGLRDKYNPKYLEAAIQNLVTEKSPRRRKQANHSYEYESYPSPPDICKTAVFAKEILPDGVSDRPYCFRTYDMNYPNTRKVRLNFGPANNVPIWKVARATSAAPGYFKEMKIKGRKYSDGGAGFNNPARMAYQELQMRAGDRDPCPIALLLSIGTGEKRTDEKDVRSHNDQLLNSRRRANMREAIGSVARASVKPFIHPFGKAKARLDRAKYELTYPEDTHVEMEAEMRKGGRPYYRLNGNEDVGALELDQWQEDTQSNVEESIAAKLNDRETKKNIEECADCLIKLRRARIAADAWLWTRFTTCKLIRCGFCWTVTENTFQKMRYHLEDDHNGNVHGMSNEDMFLLIEQQCLFEDPELEGGPF